MAFAGLSVSATSFTSSAPMIPPWASTTPWKHSTASQHPQDKVLTLPWGFLFLPGGWNPVLGQDLASCWSEFSAATCPAFISNARLLSGVPCLHCWIIVPNTSEALCLTCRYPKSVLLPWVCTLCSLPLPKPETLAQPARAPPHKPQNWPWAEFLKYLTPLDSKSSLPTACPLMQTPSIPSLGRCRASHLVPLTPTCSVLGIPLPATKITIFKTNLILSLSPS